jgi:hypothetical protein
MDRVDIHTPLGMIPLVGRLHGGQARPALLAIGGLFPPKDYLHDLPGRVPGEVVVGAIPGMRTPVLRSNRFSDMSAAYDTVVERLFPGRPVVVLGISTGALVAMGMRAPAVQAKVLVEPFLSTAKLWPLIPFIRMKLECNPDNALMRDCMWTLFGVAPDTVEDRSYHRLADELAVPTHVVCGSMPMLPERSLAIWPSLTDESDRARLAANRFVRLHEGPPDTGHSVSDTGAGRTQVQQLLWQILEELAAPLTAAASV